MRDSGKAFHGRPIEGKRQSLGLRRTSGHKRRLLEYRAKACFSAIMGMSGFWLMLKPIHA